MANLVNMTSSSCYREERDVYVTRMTKIHRIPETEEFRVRFYIDSKYQVDADYFTNDLDDAHGTAEFWRNSLQGEVQ